MVLVARFRISCIFSWEEKQFFIFSCEEKHFAELWIAVSYLALEAIVESFSAKVGVLQKTVLKCSSSKFWFSSQLFFKD